MEFTIIANDKRARLGELTTTQKKASCTLNTPGCFMYSRSGLLPHLTDDTRKGIVAEPRPWLVPLATVVEQPGVEVMEAYRDGYQSFISQPSQVLFLTMHDTFSSQPRMYRYNEEKSVSVWAPSGRQKFTAESYAKLVEAFQFSTCTAPSDQIQATEETTKRCRKSRDRSTRFLDQFLASKSLAECSVIAAVEGGQDIALREMCADDVAVREGVAGYSLSGLEFTDKQFVPVLDAVLKRLPEVKPRFLFGVFSPLEILDAIDRSVDVFDTTTACYATDRGCAFNFQIHCDGGAKQVKDASIDSQAEKANGFPKITSSESSVPAEQLDKSEIRKDLRVYEMDMNDRRYFDDFLPLVADCTCYCCVKYTRAYVHHLLITKEMLGRVLLTTHNLHHWLTWFAAVRERIRDGTLDEMKRFYEQLM